LRSRRNPFHREWDAACARFFADESLRGAWRDRDDLEILTYNTRGAPYLLERCFAHLGLRLVVLGGGKDDWRWDYKISLVRDYLRSGSCGSEFVLCLDGDDVLVLADPAVILRRFLRRNCEMLFSSTAWNHPASSECWRFEESVAVPADRAHCHLNAGGYLAGRGYLTAKLDEVMAGAEARSPWCTTTEGFDDQLAWRHMHRRYFPAIKVDSPCRVFIRFDPAR
jgi:hypothetical protein